MERATECTALLVVGRNYVVHCDGEHRGHQHRGRFGPIRVLWPQREDGRDEP